MASSDRPGDVTWRAGIDAWCGFVKNGGLSAEALIFFRPELRDPTLYRRKRGGHLLSKGRYLAAQILAMLEGDLWLRNARAANAAATRLAEAGGSRLALPVEANEIFLKVTLRGSGASRPGFIFYYWRPGAALFVTPGTAIRAVGRFAGAIAKYISDARKWRPPHLRRCDFLQSGCLSPYLITLIWG